ncbi:L-threonylcarbamoyladenylate synthase [Acidithrix sp. C25]|uniref:L-threonylcarbamoyladenylate synthase n=1 Tax=Acidithrix sp. C25 TaxID=1671482 RepID=UPI00191BA0C7|nr:L-threonylcarbamoyladenylate synthase [Acidithrix sp. C25]CAG4929448.1 unnamed protein product [Acidithrix sp. C25]
MKGSTAKLLIRPVGTGDFGVVSEFLSSAIPQWTKESLFDLYEGGAVVMLPTDTVYGLTSRIDTDGADRIYEIKCRPRSMALPVVVGSIEQAIDLFDLSDEVIRRKVELLAQRFWPGSLTIVAPRDRELIFRGGDLYDRTIGVRVPDDDIVRQVTCAVGPIFATSANLHGMPSIVRSKEIFAADNLPLKNSIDAIVVCDGLSSGISSTVVSLIDGELAILRKGSIEFDEIISTL